MATIYKRGKSWWLRDAKFRRSLGTRNRALALLLLEDYESEKLRPKKALRLDSAVNQYLDDIKPFVKPPTLSDKWRILENFKNSATQRRNIYLQEIETEHVNNYLATRHNLSPYRWNTERRVISTFLNWAINRNLYTHVNPTRQIRSKKEPRGKAARALSTGEIKRLMLVIRRKTQLGKMVRFAFNTGMRIQEIENLQWQDIDFEHQSAKVQAHNDGWSPKDYEARTVPLNTVAFKIVNGEEKNKPLSPFVFLNTQGGKHGRDLITALSRAMKRAKIPHGGWHLLRHTFATRAVEAGVDLESLRVIMGHTDIKTLLKYVHVSEEYKSRVIKKLRVSE